MTKIEDSRMALKLGSSLDSMALTTWAGVRIPPTAFWGGDLMEGNPRDPSHLRVRELWVRVVVRPLLPRCAPRHVKIGFKWVETMNAPASPFFFFHQKKKEKRMALKLIGRVTLFGFMS